MTITLTATVAVIIYQIDSGANPGVTRLLAHVPYGDKWCHFLLFGLLAGGLDVSLEQRDIRLLGRDVSLAATVFLLVGTLEELSQFAFPERTPDVLDWLATALGIVAITALSRRAPRRQPAVNTVVTRP